MVAEKVVLNGITHTEIGMWICKEWGLPEEIIELLNLSKGFIDKIAEELPAEVEKVIRLRGFEF